MTLYLKIDQDTNHTFFSLYDKLGPLERKVWLAAIWWVKKFPCAHPKQIKIASHIGCTRKHVNRAFAKFKSYGWLYLTSRGARRTKIIGIPTQLVVLDVNKREYFKRIEVTSKVTHSSSRFPNNTGRASEIHIPEYIGRLEIPLEFKLKLSLVPEYIFLETKYQCEKKAKTGWKPDNEIKYFVGTAVRMAENKGHFIDWKKYMQNRRAA